MIPQCYTCKRANASTDKCDKDKELKSTLKQWDYIMCGWEKPCPLFELKGANRC